jgi:Ni/Co efflux regulator RcnB
MRAPVQQFRPAPQQAPQFRPPQQPVQQPGFSRPTGSAERSGGPNPGDVGGGSRFNSSRHFGGASSTEPRHFGGTDSGEARHFGESSSGKGRHFGGTGPGEGRRFGGSASGETHHFGAGKDARKVGEIGSPSHPFGGYSNHPASAGGRPFAVNQTGKMGGPSRSPRGAARAAASRVTHETLRRASGGSSYAYGGRTYGSFVESPYAWPEGYSYQPFVVGAFLPAVFWTPNYFVEDYSDYGLAPPPAEFGWIRYGPDLLLINLDNGEIRDRIAGFFEEVGVGAAVAARPVTDPTYYGDPDHLPGDPPPPG